MHYRYAEVAGGEATEAGAWLARGSTLATSDLQKDGYALDPRLCVPKGNLALLVDHDRKAGAIVGSVRNVQPSEDGKRLLGDVLVADPRLAALAAAGVSLPLSIGFDSPDQSGWWALNEVSVVAVGMDAKAQTARDDVRALDGDYRPWLM